VRLATAGCILAAAALASPVPARADAANAPPPRPNVVFILADDLGWGDLSSYGARDLETPQIDRLAREGIRFSDFYAAANTCSPSRAALMTGRYPLRTGVNAVLFHDTPEGLPLEEITIAEALRDAGYRTAMIGKWHLGPSDAYMPWNQGFEEFFGVAHSNDEKNFFVYDGPHRIPETVDQSKLIRRYTDRALDFLRRAAREPKPFFLYFAHNAPHVPLHPSAAFVGRSKRGTYGDVVEELDASVGEILAALDELGIADRTLVVFTSDNGPWLAMRDWGGNAGGLRDGKGTTFEGGHRVPLLVRWPGHVPAGAEEHRPANMMDWFPTLVELAGGTLPQDRVIDGRSLVAVLRGTGARDETSFLYPRLRVPVLDDQAAKIGAVREGRWKLVLPQRGFYPRLLEPLMKVGLYHYGLMLFDLDADRGEEHDVAAAHPDVVARLRGEIDEFLASAHAPPPVLVSAAPEDHHGWEKMWTGVAEGMLLAAAVVVAAVWLLVRAIRSLRRARR